MPDSMDSFDEERRQWLVRMLAAGVYTGLGTSGLLIPRFAFPERIGEVPAALLQGRSIYNLDGVVKVNGVAADINTPITASDTIETGDKSYVIFVVGKDAFILRSNSSLTLEPEAAQNTTEKAKDALVNTLRLVTGKLLSVFGKTRHRIKTPTATIGIRGTGVYVESETERSYVCTCYGTTDISAVNDSSSSETIVSEHHDAPRYVYASGDQGQLIEPAPFKNHDDEELLLIEELVGRRPPFPVPGGRRRSGIRPY